MTLSEALTLRWEYIGPSPICKGNSEQNQRMQWANEQEQQAIQQQYLALAQKEFGMQSAIYQQMVQTFSPILAAGPEQQGFSPGQLSALESQNASDTATQFSNAEVAANEKIAQEGRGTTLPGGAQAQLAQEFKTGEAATQSQNRLNLNLANYALGRENFLTAANALSGAGNILSPANAAFGNAAGQGGNVNSAAGAANTATNINATTGFGSILGKVLGGLAGTLVGRIPLPILGGGGDSGTSASDAVAAGGNSSYTNSLR